MKRFTANLILDDAIATAIINLLNDTAAEGDYQSVDYIPPRIVDIELSVFGPRAADGRVVGHASVDGQVINTCTTPSALRSLAALGYENKDAHSHKLYRSRYGKNYRLVLASSNVKADTNVDEIDLGFE